MSIDKFTSKNKNVGGVTVARLLPQAKRRTIGAWCFLDHVRFDDNDASMQVGAHPHTNLQTFTWMLAGEIRHQDSLGHHQLIRPGQVNLMTAGTGDTHGISHTEHTPEGVQRLHAVQLWIALPASQNIPPSFHHYPKLPEWSENGIDYILTTGSYGGYTAPTLQYSPLVGVDIRIRNTQTFNIPVLPNWEYGLLVISGSLKTEDGIRYGTDELAVLTDCTSNEQPVRIHAEAGTHLMLLGGEPLQQPVFMWWNFIGDSRDTLRRAVADWNSGHPRFGKIDLSGTTLQRIPAPEMP